MIQINFVLVVLSTIGLGQTPFKSLTIHIDTVQFMSWELGLDYKTAKDQNKIKYNELYLFNYDILKIKWYFFMLVFPVPILLDCFVIFNVTLIKNSII